MQSIFLGMCLSTRSAGCPDVTVHGPEGCMRLYEATKAFVILHDFTVKNHQASDGVFEDNAITARHVPLTNNKTVMAPNPK